MNSHRSGGSNSSARVRREFGDNRLLIQHRSATGAHRKLWAHYRALVRDRGGLPLVLLAGHRIESDWHDGDGCEVCFMRRKVERLLA